MDKKLTGAISGHIEQVMLARILEAKGQTAASSMHVLKRDESHAVKKEPKVKKKRKGTTL